MGWQEKRGCLVWVVIPCVIAALLALVIGILING
jgi:hypothetical protein